MSSLLYRLGRGAYRGKGWVLLAWLLILALLGGLAGLVMEDFDDAFRIPGTQSQEALDQLSATFPQAGGTSATLVVVAPDGKSVDDPALITALSTARAEFEKLPMVTTASDPYDESLVRGMISDDRSAAVVTLQLDGEAGSFTDDELHSLQQLAATVSDDLGDAVPGAQASLGGEVFGANPPEMSATEALGVLVALVVLTITLGSLAAAFIPLITAIIGVALSMALLLIATSVASIGSSTPMLAVMLGLAVGIDYALFILSRHRELLSQGLDPEESAAQATATSGSAVVFAGLTVIIALVGLSVARIPFLTAMGLAAAVAVFIAVLIALTALPAFMGIAGKRLSPSRHRNRRRFGRRAAEDHQPDLDAAAEPPTPGRFFAAWVRVVTKIPALTIALVLVAMTALAIPAKDLQVALPDASQDAPGSPTRTTYDLLAEHFGPGFNGPLIVTANIVTSDDPLGVMAGLKADIEKLPGVASVPLSTPNMTADTGIVQVIPTTGPQDERTRALVQELRDHSDDWSDRYGVETAVTGFTAVAIDISSRLSGALLPFGIFVVGLSLVLLTMVFRSIAVPIKATLGYLISVLGTFGAVTMVFVYGWGADLINLHQTGPVISFLPIIMMGILFGLAMDYEVFLVARMREDHVHGVEARRAVQTGFIGSGRVVLSAGLIMIAVFAFFVPAGTPDIKAIAFALAVGVALDAFVVRMTLVPAVLTLFGERAWWLPAWLERRLPKLDVEGESLHHQLRMAQWPSAEVAYGAYAEELTVRTPTQTVFAPVDVRVLPGQVLVVEGPRLARTGLLLTLAGRLRPTAGQARVAGFLLPDQARALRHRVAVIDPVTVEATGQLRRVVALDTQRVPVVAMPDADIEHGAPRDALLALIDDATLSGRTVLLGADDADDLADVLPSDHLRVLVRADDADPASLDLPVLHTTGLPQ